MSELQETLFLTRSPGCPPTSMLWLSCAHTHTTLTQTTYTHHKIVKKNHKFVNFGVSVKIFYFLVLLLEPLCSFCLHYHSCNFMNISENVEVV